MAESKDEQKSLLMKVKEESERANLKLNIKKKQYDLKDIYQNINKEIKLSGRASLVAQLVKTPPAMQEFTCNAEDPGSIPGSGRYPGKGNGNPLQYSCLKNFMGRGACGLQSTGSQRVGHN